MSKDHAAKNPPRLANHLRGEPSPYLKQHAFNPVDWYPWSDEALKKAASEDKPLLVSIGYSACHWCHVMERESFEDPAVARIMNENFVNIKVDREERPDLDSLYMKAVQAMTGHAGWPLTVFATPAGEPFYGGTYFPPEDGFGLPSFRKALMTAALAYKKRRDRVNAITEDIRKSLSRRPLAIEIGPGLSGGAFEAAKLFFDPVFGGFGKGAKFPHAMFLKFLIRYHRRTGEKHALYIIRKTLSSMAAGGVCDQIGGGFHRYSIDEAWDVPHFEKMLYDNALLLELYSLVAQETGLEFYGDVAAGTAAYLLRDMRSGGGAFYASEDADTGGVEGAYYLWDHAEIKAALGDDAKRLMDFYSMTDEGNFEGKNIPRIDDVKRRSEDRTPDDMKKLGAALLDIRLRRPRPDKDAKIIAAWNGLAITAFAQASESLARPDLLEDAQRCARFVLGNMMDGNGRLARYYLDGRPDRPAALEDYALFGAGLAKIFEVTGKTGWLDEAERLAKRMTALFYDESERLFFDAESGRKDLFVRERDLFDNDVPSGNSAAAGLLMTLSRFKRDAGYRELAEEILRSIEGIGEEPLSHGNFLCVLEEMLAAAPLQGQAVADDEAAP